jgi:hypothetical protein
MAAGSTYTPIATTTLGSAQSSVTFNSFSGYTDLRLVLNAGTSALGFLYIQFNGDTGTNYSATYIAGTGSTAGSGRSSNTNNAQLTGDTGFSTSITGNATVDFMNYSNTTTYKTLIARQNNADNSTGYGGTGAAVALWRNTAAITSMTIKAISSGTDKNWIIGSTFTLYGIAAA